jgi:FMN phosphatase YigB (HAD superfamily)
MKHAATGALDQGMVNVLSRERVLVFDFDGTVALGHGPVRSYARAVASTLPAGRASAFLGSFETRLDATGATGVATPIDGYDLVRLLADAYDVPAGARGSAYLTSRLDLGTSAAPVIAPAGLAGFLAEAGKTAYRVLATNAPAIRIEQALAALGLTGAFDVVHTSVGKPAGFGAVLDDLIDRLPGAADPASGLLSIGDIWANDLEPAHRRGASTALVGGHLPVDATPTHRAGHLPELYPALHGWLAS